MDGTRLNKIFGGVLFGKAPLGRHNHKQFLEAVYSSKDAPGCISKILSSDKGPSLIQQAMRIDLSISFLDGHAAALLEFLAKEELVDIGSGAFLRRIVLSIVDPPIFWDAFTKAFHDGVLQERAQKSFAWLLWYLLSQSSPKENTNEYISLAKDTQIQKSLLSSPHQGVRRYAQKIKCFSDAHSRGSPDPPTNVASRPGGRHDNDFSDFREIAIMPTSDELDSTEPPFLRPTSAPDGLDTGESRVWVHLDNQFRLNREDMVFEMREESQIFRAIKKGKRRGLAVDELQLDEIHYVDQAQAKNFYKFKWGVQLRCKNDLWAGRVKSNNPQDRKKFVGNNRNIIRHLSRACLLADGQIVAFPCINRVEDLLAANPPIIVLQFEERNSAAKALLKLKVASQVRLIQIETAIFAYEPILKALQEMKTLPLSSELIDWDPTNGSIPYVDSYPSCHVNAIKAAGAGRDLRDVLGTPKQIILDKAQTGSLLAGLTQGVSLIQGPPGTGKSFIGALLAKCIHDRTQQKILVVCYTNHALDQFLEDLIAIGIPKDSLTRLGGKASDNTKELSAWNQISKSVFKLTRADWQLIDDHKRNALMHRDLLVQNYGKYQNFRPNHQTILDHLEVEHPEYFAAFYVPEHNDDDMIVVGSRGRGITRDYLLDNWVRGKDAGVLKDDPDVVASPDTWAMPTNSRKVKYARWTEELLEECVQNVYKAGSAYNECLAAIDKQFNQNMGELLRSKRIIGCTTTGAAMFREDIAAAHVDVLLVEEAGEILESHVLTAMGEDTKQLILIGDHKQLRPKINNYNLSVEKGDGYELNQSLFERLVKQGYPHTTLEEQHRMRPEISMLVRELTYPELRDAPGTFGRPNLTGLQDNVIFIHHDKPEEDFKQLAEMRDMNAKSSKQNQFEVDMVVNILRYLAQQGYGTSKIAVLTPYLGQLRKLQNTLKEKMKVDSILNDMDSYDLVQAGVIPASASNTKDKTVRLATIDNYQGEESDIVIISLTRSNPDNDIGFMRSAERLTVLLSRARIGMIMIGNSKTFTLSKKGEVWRKLMDILIRERHVYEGLPVKCARHPTRLALLKRPEDFTRECPDGGCLEPCSSILNCGIHTCPSKCHQLSDHSKIQCGHPMTSKCPNGHIVTWPCYQIRPPVTCTKCDREKAKKERELAEKAKRELEQEKHDQQMAEINDKISQAQMKVQNARLSEERKKALEQKQRDLQVISALASAPLPQRAPPPQPDVTPPTIVSPPLEPRDVQAQATEMPIGAEGRPLPKLSANPPVRPTVRPMVLTPSAQKSRWTRQKTMDGSLNEHVDKIMDMTGLEDVKKQVLDINAKVDTAKRQGVSVQDERFNVAMLGNPGTGKTTVARLYGKFLASVQVLPADNFVETTGSRLTNDGVPGLKKMLEEILKAGGGTIFIDEAYQLTGKGNVQGGQILDFLLAEMENNIGKLCFIVAGYDREMESFFEHNPGLNSRVPYRLKFKDYDDAELLDMLSNTVNKTWGGRMKVEGGEEIKGLYGRIAIRRLGSNRGKPGFGNARAVANLFAKVRERQAARIDRERAMGRNPDDFLLAKEDLIGPDPSKVMTESAAWTKLQSMIGLGSVKRTVADLFTMIQTNYQRELLEKKPQQVSLNRVFLGNPGTGKTTVAKLYGQILAELGLISNGEVVVKNPSDFVGNVLGASESQTKAILSNTVGKVLVIDEAYGLYGGKNAGGSDIYKTAVIDTIVAEVQSVPGEDRCVLLLGYKEQLEEMFQNVNPGLARRFSIGNAFHFNDYDDSELLEALELKLKDQDLTATDLAKKVAVEVLARARNRPHFGNIGEVENMLSQAKVRYQQRQSELPLEQRSPDAPLEPQDFDPDFNRSDNAEANIEKMFADVIGCDDIVKKLKDYQRVVKTRKALGHDYRSSVPTNFVFKGPPGTGKTTTARKMGQVYYDMGFLSSTEVIECSASDLVGQYVGQTGPKTKSLLEKALGRVLFIDEAYRLSEGPFAKEAIDELVGLLTQEAFRGKLLVILAGYDKDINELLGVNSGLASRFPDEIVFSNLSPAQCLDILQQKLSKDGIHLRILEDRDSADYLRAVDILQELSHLPSWGNARDMETLAKRMAHVVFMNPSPIQNGTATSLPTLLLPPGEEIGCLEAMLKEQKGRVLNKPARQTFLDLLGSPMQVQSADAPTPPHASFSTEVKKASVAPPVLDIEKDAQEIDSDSERDPDVSDEIWNQLQVDKRAAEETERQSLEKESRLKDEIQQQEQREREAGHLLKLKANTPNEDDELKRERERARLQEIMAKREIAKRVAELKEEERRRKEEARVQHKLREMGVCVAGFRWIKQSSGYRCAGGSHFISNAALGIS